MIATNSRQPPNTPAALPAAVDWQRRQLDVDLELARAAMVAEFEPPHARHRRVQLDSAPW